MAAKTEILKKMDEVDALMRERIEAHSLRQPALHADDTGMVAWRLRMDVMKRARDHLQQAISEELGV